MKPTMLRFTSALVAAMALTTSALAAAPTDEEKYGSADHPITLTFWTWGSGAGADVAAAYKKLHPYVTIVPTMFGSATEVYTKLGIVFKAGSGAPDMSGMELVTMPSFAAPGYLADLGAYGATVANFDPGAVSSASFNGNLYAIPTDTGPLVLYYNKEIFDKLGLTEPKTWEDYKADAEKIKASGSGFIANMDPGDSGVLLGLMQQAHAKPFWLTNGSDLTVNLADAGAAKVAQYWSDMLKEGLVEPEPAWSAEWFNQLADGTFATWITGAWGGSVLTTSIPQAAGKWRVAMLPQWTAGETSNGVWGGSGTVVTAQSPNKAAATAFAEWFSVDQYIDRVDDAPSMPFPASLQVLQDPRYAAAASPFLGGQKPGALYIEASKEVNADWQFLPYELYANTIYKDTVGQHVDGDHNLAAGLKAWQDEIVSYGQAQGFTVTAK